MQGARLVLFFLLSYLVFCGMVTQNRVAAQQKSENDVIRELRTRLDLQREDILGLQRQRSFLLSEIASLKKELKTAKAEQSKAKTQSSDQDKKRESEIQALRQKYERLNAAFQDSSQALSELRAINQEKEDALSAAKSAVMQRTKSASLENWLFKVFFFTSLATTFFLLFYVWRMRKKNAQTKVVTEQFSVTGGTERGNRARTTTKSEPTPSVVRFAESVAQGGNLVRLSDQKSDDKKYILEIQPDDASRAVVTLNKSSRYYMLWLQHAERFLSFGVGVIRPPQPSSTQTLVEEQSGSAICVNGVWRIEQPIQLKFA